MLLLNVGRRAVIQSPNEIGNCKTKLGDWRGSIYMIFLSESNIYKVRTGSRDSKRCSVLSALVRKQRAFPWLTHDPSPKPRSPTKHVKVVLVNECHALLAVGIILGIARHVRIEHEIFRALQIIDRPILFLAAPGLRRLP